MTWQVIPVDRLADKKGVDFYKTPPIAVQKLIEREEFSRMGPIWEPACGDGVISEELKKLGYSVESSDLYDWGYGETGVDFLKSSKKVESIITNPPYNLAEQFVRKSLGCSNKVALLLNLDFAKSKKRYPLFKESPPARIWVFSRQIAGDPRVSDFMVKAWWIWDKTRRGKTQLDWVL